MNPGRQGIDRSEYPLAQLVALHLRAQRADFTRKILARDRRSLGSAEHAQYAAAQLEVDRFRLAMRTRTCTSPRAACGTAASRSDSTSRRRSGHT